MGSASGKRLRAGRRFLLQDDGGLNMKYEVVVEQGSELTVESISAAVQEPTFLTAVATDLADTEAKQKCVAWLQVRGDTWKMEPLTLKTVRPFKLREIVLEEHAEEYDLTSEDHIGCASRVSGSAARQA